VKALILIGSLVAALVAAASAGAAPGNGATHVDISGCTLSPFGIVCQAADSVTNTTTTPSGNVSYVTNGVLAISITNPFTACSLSQTQPFHTHWLQKDGELQSRSERLTLTNTISCAGIEHTCVSTLDFHYANGDVQFSRSDLICTTP
jgi:hypothetical protein